MLFSNLKICVLISFAASVIPASNSFASPQERLVSQMRNRLVTAEQWFRNDSASPAGCGYIGAIMGATEGQTPASRSTDSFVGSQFFTVEETVLPALKKITSDLFSYCNGNPVSLLRSSKLREGLQGRLAGRCTGNFSSNDANRDELVERVICNATVLGLEQMRQAGEAIPHFSPSSSLRGKRSFFALSKNIIMTLLSIYPAENSILQGVEDRLALNTGALTAWQEANIDAIIVDYQSRLRMAAILFGDPRLERNIPQLDSRGTN